MKILFIGGTGVISTSCSAEAVANGHELFLLNRGESINPPAEGAEIITCDIRDTARAEDVMRSHEFDVVVDWVAYTREHAEADYNLFAGKTKQYVFISSASAYRCPPESFPVKETEPLSNPIWEYSRDKIRAEQFLLEMYYRENFPVTIVRPSHTYDKTKLPLQGGPTTLHRMINGKPVIVHGDGLSLWTLTHTKDFAKGFVPLLGCEKSIGQVYHITSDKALTWDQIYYEMANALGVEVSIVHVPSDVIYKHNTEWGEGLLGDKAYSMVFDNSKIRTIVPDFKAEIPFSQGAKELAEWFLADVNRYTPDSEIDKLMDELTAKYSV